MKIGNKDYKAVWEENREIFIIDQNQLPFQFRIIKINSLSEAVSAIKTMKVRGAPAIAAAAALCYALFVSENPIGEERIFQELLSSRPTAVDLHNALLTLRKSFLNSGSTDVIWQQARAFVHDITRQCRKIGEYGSKLLFDDCRILTHCNAGALATVDYGTALAPIRFAHYTGRKIFVFVDETRPRLQGSRLTAWELAQENIPHAVIADNAAGFYMWRHEIDLVLTGADRITLNGDAANKIGTYEKAVLAKENDIPFYIAAPWSTFDRILREGKEIPIEERNPEEILKLLGKTLVNPQSPALNPAFDVTPAKYITGFITPAGIFKPSEIEKIWQMNITE